jgi:hypothetical protein
MDLVAFRKSLSAATPPTELDIPMQALWWDAKGNWAKAHALADQRHDTTGSWVHAYLHRREGDHGNAGYWYRRAGKEMPARLSLDEEWGSIVSKLLRG